jgi:hypothetical protein
MRQDQDDEGKIKQPGSKPRLPVGQSRIDVRPGLKNLST